MNVDERFSSFRSIRPPTCGRSGGRMDGAGEPDASPAARRLRNHRLASRLVTIVTALAVGLAGTVLVVKAFGPGTPAGERPSMSLVAFTSTEGTISGGEIRH